MLRRKKGGGQFQMYAFDTLTLAAGKVCFVTLTGSFALMLFEHWFVLTRRDLAFSELAREIPLVRFATRLGAAGLILGLVGFALRIVTEIGWQIEHWSDPIRSPVQISRDDSNRAIYYKNDW
jgi:hypothetical protein